jgi:hypothetical protein
MKVWPMGAGRQDGYSELNWESAGEKEQCRRLGRVTMNQSKSQMGSVSRVAAAGRAEDFLPVNVSPDH